MFVVNTDELPKDQIFNCCSYNMMKFLTDNDMEYIKICQKWNKRTSKLIDCYVFIQSPRLNQLRVEWTNRGKEGNLYFNKGGEK